MGVFRQNPSSQTKRHVESNGNGGSRVPELHRGKTDPEVVRQQRGDKRGSGSSPGASSNGLARKPDKSADRQKKMGELSFHLSTTWFAASYKILHSRKDFLFLSSHFTAHAIHLKSSNIKRREILNQAILLCACQRVTV